MKKALQGGYSQIIVLLITLLSIVSGLSSLTTAQKQSVTSQLGSIIQQKMAQEDQAASLVNTSTPANSSTQQNNQVDNSVSSYEPTAETLPTLQYNQKIINWSNAVFFLLEKLDTAASCELTITGDNINIQKDSWENVSAQTMQGVSYMEGKRISVLVSPSYVDSNTLLRGKSYNYSITCQKNGYQDAVISGTISTQPAQ